MQDRWLDECLIVVCLNVVASQRVLPADERHLSYRLRTVFVIRNIHARARPAMGLLANLYLYRSAEKSQLYLHLIESAV
jgi:hypothetical protein